MSPVVTMYLLSALSRASGQGPVLDPPQFSWTSMNGYFEGTLEIGVATLDVGGDSFTTRAYRQAGGAFSIPGPTITMSPGNKYVLRFHNTLPFIGASPDTNVFKDPNVANVHTHGLHISGESPGDDVHRAFEGQTGGDYVWDIPADHMGGTYWYHAHHHGSTYLQVSGGTFGMVVIDDSNDGIPPTVAAMAERQLVLGKVDPSAAGTGGDTIMGGSLSSATFTANGVVGGTVAIPADEWQHFRVLHATDGGADTVHLGTCEAKLLARDGVWRTTAPADLPNGADISLTGASRADIAVRCPASADGSAISVGNDDVATFAVGPAGSSSPSPYDSQGAAWSAARPSYLRDLRAEGNVHVEGISLGARTVMGRKFEHDNPNLVYQAGQVIQWDLPSGAGNHPFHLHVYHMQSVDCGTSAQEYEEGEYYDVINTGCSVRFDLSDPQQAYLGRTIMHCHILAHEDQGAMGWLKVEGNAKDAPTFPTAGYAEWYTLATTPSPPQPSPAPSPSPAPAPSPSPPSPSPADPCGNGVCEVSLGEDCNSCPADCNAKLNGKASNQFCCGSAADGCTPAGCNADGFQCQGSGPSPAPAPQPAPAPAPAPEPPTCTAYLGDSCGKGVECCEGGCSGGKNKICQ